MSTSHRYVFFVDIGKIIYFMKSSNSSIILIGNLIGGVLMLVNSDKKWDYALGMIKVDGLEPTPEFKRLIEKEKRGEMTMDDIKQTLDKKYKIKE